MVNVNIDIKIKREDFSKVEIFLFSLTYPSHCYIKISFENSDEVYKYRTVDLCGKLVLITI